jgi:BlaI family penicillinase repressor
MAAMSKPDRVRRDAAGDLTPAQLELMQLVWERGELSASDAHAALAQRRPVAPTTVMTLLQRLEKRGWLAHRVEGRAHVYRAARDRSRSVGAILRRLRDVAFGGSTAGLMSSLLDAGDVTADEIRRLKKRLAEFEKGAKTGNDDKGGAS